MPSARARKGSRERILCQSEKSVYNNTMIPKELVTAKSRVISLYSTMSVEEAVKKMTKGHFQMVPVLEKDSGRYLYSLSAQDLLNFIVSTGSYERALPLPLSNVPIDRLILPCVLDTDIDSMVDLLANQNFVPLVDGSGIFQGIITRKKVIYMLVEQNQSNREE